MLFALAQIVYKQSGPERTIVFTAWTGNKTRGPLGGRHKAEDCVSGYVQMLYFIEFKRYSNGIVSKNFH